MWTPIILLAALIFGLPVLSLGWSGLLPDRRGWGSVALYAVIIGLMCYAFDYRH